MIRARCANASALSRGAQCIGHACHLKHFGDIMDADDVRAVENAGGDRRGRAPDSLARRSGLATAGERSAEKALARSSDKERIAQVGEGGEPREQFVVLGVRWPETDTRIEHDLGV